MKTIKKYVKEAFVAVTSLGTAYFYLIIILLFLSLGENLVALHLVLGLLLCYCFVFIVRIFYFKDRPKKENYYNLFTRINASSFPSLHMMGSLFVATVIAVHIKSTWTTVLLYFVSLTIGYSRIYLKKHYLIDVFSGLVLGILMSLIYFLAFS